MLKDFKLGAVIPVLLGIASAGLSQTIYTFTRIADTNAFFIAFSPPSINGNGRAAFSANLRPNGNSGIYSGDGTEQSPNAYTVLALEGPAFDVGKPGSYVGNRVAFFAGTNPQNATGGYFSSDGTSLQMVALDPTIHGATIYPPLMNAAGQIAYLAGNVSGKVGFYVAQNGVAKPIYLIPQFFSRGPVEMHNALNFGNTQVTDSGMMFIEADFFNLTSPGQQEIDLAGMLQGNLTGVVPSEVVHDGSDASGNTFTSIEAFAANNFGQAASLVVISDNNGLFYRLLRISHGASHTVLDTRSNPFEITGVSSMCLAINDNGNLIFQVDYKDANGVNRSGIFTGPDPIRDKVIATGDSLFGSIVGGLDFSRVGFNNKGQAAFRASLANGNTMVVRADPSNGGTVVNWVGQASGSFNDPGNWQPQNGDPPRVPEKTTSVADTAVFSGGSADSVALSGAQHADRLVIRNDEVTFSTGSLKVDALSFDEPSLLLDNAHLQLLSSTALTNNHALIGESLQSRVDVGLGATWNTLGSLRIGGDGTGIVNIDNFGEVFSAEARIGAGHGGGQVTVGHDGRWLPVDLAIGAGGKGALAIQDGGSVESEVVAIGLLPGIGNKATAMGDSHWEILEMSVGGEGTGTLEVKDGAFVQPLQLRVGTEPAASGTVMIKGGRAGGIPSHVAAGELRVGDGGAGEINISDGGLLTVEGGDAYVGEKLNSRGTITVSGVNGTTGTPSTLRLNSTEELLLGGSGAGTLVIEGGARVLADHVSMNSGNAFAQTEAQVTGSPSRWVLGDLIVSSPGDAGYSVVTLLGGTVDAEIIFVNPQGMVRGFGALNVTNRMVNGGVISPGLSPGTITLNGNYTQTNNGRLKMEIGGPTPGVSHDLFVVNGSATLGGTLELRFINGFAPKQGDVFNFVQVTNNLDGGFDSIEIKNLDPGFEFGLMTNGVSLSLVASNDATFITPLQNQISVSNITSIGGITYLPYSLSVTDNCTIVETPGGITRQGQDLFIALNERPDPGCLGSSANASGTLVLGALQPGHYQMNFVADGVTVYTVPFDVAAPANQVLELARTAGLELKLQINGLPTIEYIIQESEDLQSWNDLPAHLGKFLGPYSIYEPILQGQSRFYRVKIQ